MDEEVLNNIIEKIEDGIYEVSDSSGILGRFNIKNKKVTILNDPDEVLHMLILEGSLNKYAIVWPIYKLIAGNQHYGAKRVNK